MSRLKKSGDIAYYKAVAVAVAIVNSWKTSWGPHPTLPIFSRLSNDTFAVIKCPSTMDCIFRHRYFPPLVDFPSLRILDNEATALEGQGVPPISLGKRIY